MRRRWSAATERLARRLTTLWPRSCMAEICARCRMAKLLLNASLVLVIMVSFGCRWGATPSAQIQTKAVVLKHAEPDGFTMIGIMGAYEPQSRSFWWAATPMIAEPGMLESLYERCKFAMNGGRVVSFCVLGNAVTTSTAQEYAGSLEQGLTKAQQTLQDNQNLMAVSAGARGVAFDLKEKSGVDMNSPPGVRPTVVRSVTRTDSGFLVDVACGCGDAALTLDRNYDFVSLKKK